LRSQIRAVLKMLGSMAIELEGQMLTFIREHPTYGLRRTEAELKSIGTSVGHTGIYNILKRRCLTAAKAPSEWGRNLSGEIITQDERTRDKEKAKNNHVEIVIQVN